MAVFVSLLRGINVSGQRKIRMPELAEAHKSLGFEDVATYLQSGNVVFATKRRGAAEIASSVEGQIRSCFGCDVTVLIRTPRDLQRIVDGNPYSAEAAKDPRKVHVTFLAQRPSRAKLSGIEAPASGDDVFSRGLQEIYLHCPGGYGRTKLNNAFFERKLSMPATTRNWRTVEALHEMAHRPGRWPRL
jgi:uncharacterized protein (DUF1697 family)